MGNVYGRWRAVLGILWAAACFASPRAPTQGSPASVGAITFTTAQVSRGARTFDAICRGCHTVTEEGDSPRHLLGRAFLERWNTVGDLYGKVSLTMPANHVLSLSGTQYADVVAFLLSANGLHSGSRPLTADRELLRDWYLGNSRARSDTPQTQAADTAHGATSAKSADRGRRFFSVRPDCAIRPNRRRRWADRRVSRCPRRISAYSLMAFRRARLPKINLPVRSSSPTGTVWGSCMRM